MGQLKKTLHLMNNGADEKRVLDDSRIYKLLRVIRLRRSCYSGVLFVGRNQVQDFCRSRKT